MREQHEHNDNESCCQTDQEKQASLFHPGVPL
jgi:hypothetical protein